MGELVKIYIKKIIFKNNCLFILKYIILIMTVQTQSMERRLRETFADTLDEGNSLFGILIVYNEGEQVRTEIGIPYSIINDALEIGPYIKNIVTSPPSDYDKRKKQIPIEDIVRFRRIELSDIL